MLGQQEERKLNESAVDQQIQENSQNERKADDPQHSLWKSELNLDRKMNAEICAIEEKRKELLQEMLPKDANGKHEWHGRVFEQTLQGVPLRHLVSIYNFDRLKYDFGGPSGNTSLLVACMRLTETFEQKHLEPEVGPGTGNKAVDYFMNLDTPFPDASALE